MSASGKFEWQSVRRPCLAAIAAGIEMAESGNAADLGRRVAVYGYLEHAARWDIADVEPLPCFTEISASEQRSCLLSASRRATATRARGKIQRLRIVRRND